MSYLVRQASNEAQIGASHVFMKHFVALLLASLGSGAPIYEASQLVFEILINISSRLDLNGAKKPSQSLWLEDCLDPKGFPQLKPRSSATIPCKSESFPITSTLLSYIVVSLQQSLDREQTKRGLDLLTKISMNVDNVEIFATAPDTLTSILVELLCVNVSATEPLCLSDFKSNSGARGARLPACASSFFSEISDTEIRDLSLEAIWSLCTFSQVTHNMSMPSYFSLLRVPCHVTPPNSSSFLKKCTGDASKIRCCT